MMVQQIQYYITEKVTQYQQYFITAKVTQYQQYFITAKVTQYQQYFITAKVTQYHVSVAACPNVLGHNISVFISQKKLQDWRRVQRTPILVLQATRPTTSRFLTDYELVGATDDE
jgi:hypothetical protein